MENQISALEFLAAFAIAFTAGALSTAAITAYWRSTRNRKTI